MKCYECKNEASVKIGTANGNILAGFFNGKVWAKEEKYYCRKCYENIKKGIRMKIENNYIYSQPHAGLFLSFIVFIVGCFVYWFSQYTIVGIILLMISSWIFGLMISEEMR